jgi:hypothetical protein
VVGLFIVSSLSAQSSQSVFWDANVNLPLGKHVRRLPIIDHAYTAPVPHRPWYLRAATNIGRNAKLAAVDCIRDTRMRFECLAVVGAMVYDAKTTRDFERYYPMLREGNPLFGGQAKPWRIDFVGGLITFVQLDGDDYLRRNQNRFPWDFADTASIVGLHVYAGLSNEGLIRECQAQGLCR